MLAGVGSHVSGGFETTARAIGHIPRQNALAQLTLREDILSEFLKYIGSFPKCRN